jgi:hypothetical protein
VDLDVAGSNPVTRPISDAQAVMADEPQLPDFLRVNFAQSSAQYAAWR